MPKLYITCDHAAFDLKTKIIHRLSKLKIDIIDLVPVCDPDDDYPTTAKLLAIQIKNDISFDIESYGIAVCGSGQGICMAMNRFPFVRAAQPRTVSESARTREHNDSNVMCFGCMTVNLDILISIIQNFIDSPFSHGARHERRIEMLSDINYTKIS